MAKHVVFFSVPHLRPEDVDRMPSLAKLRDNGAAAALVPQFPAMTWPAQVAMMTGEAPNRTGIPGNGIYWKDEDRVEMWIYWNELIETPQLWDVLERQPTPLTSAAWFPLLAKGATATYGISPKPKHNPDGTETMWCWTRPEPLYEELLKEFGHFPLHHFWGPLSSIKATEWITDSALWLFERERPNFMNIYIPFLDYEAQKSGPDSPESLKALEELDALFERVFGRLQELEDDLEIIVAGEYVITEVDGPVYPNIMLREAGYLTIVPEEGSGGTLVAPGESRAWALVDHQIAHVYVKDPADIEKVAELFRGAPGVERVLAGDERRELEIDHPRAGDIVLVSDEKKWFAYSWWTDEAEAPSFASRVDIHRKPGYDPVEMFMNPFTKKISLDASLVKGSHGRTSDDDPKLHTLLIRSQKRPLPEKLHQKDVYGVLLEALDIQQG